MVGKPEAEPGKIDCQTTGEKMSVITDTTATDGLHEGQGGVRIKVDIRVSNGVHIHQYNLDYERLRRLVENLEAPC